jgi:hypothetical protein
MQIFSVQYAVKLSIVIRKTKLKAIREPRSTKNYQFIMKRRSLILIAFYMSIPFEVFLKKTTPVSKFSKIICKGFLAADIPLYNLRNKEFRKIFDFIGLLFLLNQQ